MTTNRIRRTSHRGGLRTIVTTGVLGLAASVALAGCSPVDTSNSDGGDDTFKVGVLASITGPLAPYGPALERGMEVGVELINANGGINGQQVEYVVGDTQSDPRSATTQARRMLTQEDVDVLIGTTSSASTLAVIPLAEAAGIPFIYPAEGESKTCDSSGEAALKYVFGAGVTPEQKMEAFVPYLLENIGDSVYFIGSDYVFPHFVNDLTAEMVVDGGGTVVGTDYAPLGTTDFSAYISRIDQAGPEVIFISVVGADGVALVNQLNEFGLADRVELTGIPTFAAEALPGFASEAQGVFTTDPYWEGLDNAVNEEFVEAYRAKYSAEDGPVSPMAAQEATARCCCCRRRLKRLAQQMVKRSPRHWWGRASSRPVGKSPLVTTTLSRCRCS